jgi:hypothetical protein
VTVTLAVAVPPAPVQVKVYVDVALRPPVLALPAVGSEPVQAPEAVQDPAPVVVHVRVLLPPGATLVGLAVKEMVGVGGSTGVAETVLDGEETLPDGSEAVT